MLFCGAGFSADALNFQNSDVGAGSQLLAFLNKALSNGGHESGFKDLKNAAEFASQKFGELGLMQRLVERYEIKNVGIDLVEICKFPWEKIYTTNYDNAIEMSLTRLGIKNKSYNNTDEPYDIEKNKTPVIHLHGYINAWNINNFAKSCILTSESYYNIANIRRWLDTFRQDVDRAEIVVFVGFNAGDFHLNDVLRDASGVREKLFFVNRESAEPDIDVRMTQSRFGSPMYIGRAGLAERIRATLQADKPQEPALSSFDRFTRIAPAAGVPPTKSIENLFLFGDIDESQLARDIDSGLSDYRVSRGLVDSIVEVTSGKGRIVLISGDICDGKTLLIKEVARRLDVSRDVFILRVPYDDILDEVSRILDAFPKCCSYS